MRRAETLIASDARVRIVPWRGNHSVALLSPTPGHQLRPETIHEAVAQAKNRGYQQIFTSALAIEEQMAFEKCGFKRVEELHLLHHDLVGIPSSSAHGMKMRRGRTADIEAVLQLDGRAFDGFWRFDRAALFDARDATPRSRFRVAVVDGKVVGYHITGAAGPMGYLQRLAVDPDFHGRGIGTALVGDALSWCMRRHCERVMVNTQISNERAYALYLHLGFETEPVGLAVLALSLLDEGQ